MAVHAANQSGWAEPDRDRIDAEIGRALHPFSKPAGDTAALRDRLMDAMWDYVGVMRSGFGLVEGLTDVRMIGSELLETGIGAGDRVFNLTWHDWLNLFAAWSRRAKRLPLPRRRARIPVARTTARISPRPGS